MGMDMDASRRPHGAGFSHMLSLLFKSVIFYYYGNFSLSGQEKRPVPNQQNVSFHSLPDTV